MTRTSYGRKERRLPLIIAELDTANTNRQNTFANSRDTLRKLTGDYRHYRQARARLVRLQQEMLKVVDALEAARVQQGEAQFRKLRAPSSPVRKPRSER